MAETVEDRGAVVAKAIAGGLRASGWVISRLTRADNRSPRQKRIDRLGADIERLNKIGQAQGVSPTTTATSTSPEIAGHLPGDLSGEYSGTSQIEAQGKACTVCLNDHFSAVSGALSEALRFARKDGIQHPEVVSRIMIAEDELNTGERIDGAPHKVAALPPTEKHIMNDMMNTSRAMRHHLSDIKNFEDLENCAAFIQNQRRKYRERMFKMRLAELPVSDRQRIRERAQELLKEINPDGN